MKVLVVLHGMPPQAGRTVVGSGLRAFANGEALRGRGHQVLYCTRAEDLPSEARAEAISRREKRPLLLTTITGEFHPPGDPRRMRRRLTAVGPAPSADEPDAPRASTGVEAIVRGETQPGMGQVGAGTGDGLAPVGGSLGAPGNPFSFTEAHELHEIVLRVDPDVVLVEALEEARRLPEGRFSVILDLFAPRLLEQQFQAAEDEREGVRVLDAIQRGDAFVFSNERQKYFHLPLLALAGVDCTRDAGAVVPISCPPDLPPHQCPADPIFIAGGVFWPWADMSNGLASLLSILEARDLGHLHLYGGEYGIRSDTSKYADPRRSLPREHPRLSFRGMVPIDQLWQEYRRGSVAFDLMAPNPEREINLSFRQVDYLRCGLPIVTSPRQIIAADLLDYGAGWVVEPGNTRGLRRLIDELLDDPAKIAAASAQAQALARDRYSWEQTIEPLDRLVRNPTRRTREDTFVARLTRTQGDLWEEHEENLQLREVVGHQRRDLDKKTEEVGALNTRISTLMGTVDRLGDSLGAVSKFKNDAVHYLQEQHGEALREVGETALDFERQSLDLRKKQDALARAQKEIAKLKQSIAELRTDNEHLEARFVARDREALGLGEDRKRSVAETDGLRDRLEALRQDLAKKESERAELGTSHAGELADLRERLVAAQSAGASSSAEADALHGELEELRADLGAARADGTKKAREVQRLQELAARQHAEHQRTLEELRADALERLERAEEAATKVAEQLRDRGTRAEEERSRLKGRLAEAQHRTADLERDAAAKERDLEGLQRRAETEAIRWQSELARQTEKSHANVRDVRDLAEERSAELQRQLEAARAAALLAEERHSAEAARSVDLEADVAKKTAALVESSRERQRLEASFLRSLDGAETAARELLERARDRIGVLEAERGALRARLDEVGQRAGDAQRELAAKDQALERGRASHELALGRAEAAALEAESAAERRLQEVKAASSEVSLAARAAANEALRERDRATAELEKARGRLADVEGDLAKKDAALAGAAAEREQLQAEFLAALDKTEGGAQALLERARDVAAKLNADRAGLKASLDEARARVRELEREVAASEASLERQQTTAEEAQLRMEASALRALERQQKAADDAEAGHQANTLRAAEAADRRQQELKETHAAQLLEANKAVDEARRSRDLLQSRLEKAQGRLGDVEGDLAKKDQALADAATERARLQTEFLAALDKAEQGAQALLERARDVAAKQNADRAGLRASLDEARARVRELEREVAAGETTLKRQQKTAEEAQLRMEASALRALERQQKAADDAEAGHQANTLRAAEAADRRQQELKETHAAQLLEANKAVDEARRSRDLLQSRLEKAQGRLGDVEGDLAKKDQALADAATERAQLQTDFLAALERAEEGATALLKRAQDAAARLMTERGSLRASLEQARGQVQTLERELESAEATRAAETSQAEQARATLEAAAIRQEQAAGQRVQEVRSAAEQRVLAARQAAEDANLERDRLAGDLARAQGRAADVEADLAKKDQALAAAAAERERLQEDFLSALDRAESGAAELLGRARDAAGRLDSERGLLKASLEEARGRVRDLERELTGANTAHERYRAQSEQELARTEAEALRGEQAQVQRVAEVRQAADERVLASRQAAESANRERDSLQGALEQARGRLADVEADLAKKDEALAAAAAERERLQEDFLSALDRAESGAAELLGRARDAAGRLDSERGLLKASLEEARGRVRDLERELTGANTAHERYRAQSEQELARTEAEALRGEQAQVQRVAEVRQAADERVLASRQAAEAASRERDSLQGALEQARGRLADVEADLAKKDEALADLTSGLERSQREASERHAAEAARAQSLLEEVRDRAASLDTERGALLSRVERAEFEAHEAHRQLRARDHALQEADRERDRLEQQFLTALETAEDRAVTTVEELRGRLNSLGLDRATLNQQLRDTTARLRDTERALAAREGELDELQRAASEAEAEWDAERDRVRIGAEERIRTAHQSMVDARQQRDLSRDELARVHSLADDLQADVAKKTTALDLAQRERQRLHEEFLGSLERAQGASEQLLEEAQERVQRLGDERQRLQGFVEELQSEAGRLAGDLGTKDSALNTAQDRLQDERERYQLALFELEELRANSQSSSSRVAEVEAELQRQQSGLESLSGELARVTAQLEEAQFEAQSVQAELNKKTAEIRDAQAERDTAWSAAEGQRAELDSEVATLRGERSALSSRLERADFELAALRADGEKKSVELEQALRQRDEVNAEKGALQAALDDALSTIRRVTEAPPPPEAEPAKKKPSERRAKSRSADAPDTSAN